MVAGEPLSLPGRLLYRALIPLGWLYGLVGLVRCAFYRWSILPSYRAAVPVIAVGNLTAGGTGKTPVVDHLVRALLARGMKVAVVSRGYGGRNVGELLVVSEGRGPRVEAADCGDEPFLLARRNPSAVVIASPERGRGVAQAVERFGAQVVVLDDAYQHLAVHRDLNLLLLDAKRPLGNGQVLPAGSLREFPRAMHRADLVLYTRCRTQKDVAARLPVAKPVIRCRHRLSPLWSDLDGRAVEIGRLKSLRGFAFAGIAHPGQFFAQLSELGAELQGSMGLGDHCDYGPADILGINEAAAAADYLVTTEKDGVKLRSCDFSKPCYQVPLELEFLDGKGLDEILSSRIYPEVRA